MVKSAPDKGVETGGLPTLEPRTISCRRIHWKFGFAEDVLAKAGRMACVECLLYLSRELLLSYGWGLRPLIQRQSTGR